MNKIIQSISPLPVPVDLYFGKSVDFSPQDLKIIKLSNVERFREKHEKDLAYNNRNTKQIKDYVPGQLVYVRTNKRLRTKLSNRFKQEIVKDNRNTTFVIESECIIHRRIFFK